MEQFCTRYNLHRMNIVDHRFITFGLVHGLIRRIHEYAVNEDHDSTFSTKNASRSRGERTSFSNENKVDVDQSVDDQVSELSERETGLSRILPLLDGEHHVDEICTTFMRSHAELSQMFKARQRVATVFK